MSETKYIPELLTYLPHRYPFLLVDKVIDIELGKSEVLSKLLTSSAVN